MSVQNLSGQLAKRLLDHVCFAGTVGSIMGKFKFMKGSGGIHNILERSPEQVAERKRLSALRRDEKRRLKKIEHMNQGKKDE